MVDVVDKATRSRMMAGIKGKNTKPELLLRSELHRRGFRFRLHARNLPGRPDLVFPKYRTVIFVHGCFWHGHSCKVFKWPQSNKLFWETKILGNRRRDRQSIRQLVKAGWRVLVIWECQVSGKMAQARGIDKAVRFLIADRQDFLVSGDR
jgi:DNA mismatch endonuclease, patch repair protein